MIKKSVSGFNAMPIQRYYDDKSSFAHEIYRHKTSFFQLRMGSQKQIWYRFYIKMKNRDTML